MEKFIDHQELDDWNYKFQDSFFFAWFGSASNPTTVLIVVQRVKIPLERIQQEFSQDIPQMQSDVRTSNMEKLSMIKQFSTKKI